MENREQRKPEVLAVVTKNGAVFVRADKQEIVKNEPQGGKPHVFNRSEFRKAWLWLHTNKDGARYALPIGGIEFIIERNPTTTE